MSRRLSPAGLSLLVVLGCGGTATDNNGEDAGEVPDAAVDAGDAGNGPLTFDDLLEAAALQNEALCECSIAVTSAVCTASVGQLPARNEMVSACWEELRVNNPFGAQAYIECLTPVLQGYAVCLRDVDGCEQGALDACLDMARDAGAGCPQLDIDGQAFEACSQATPHEVLEAYEQMAEAACACARPDRCTPGEEISWLPTEQQRRCILGKLFSIIAEENLDLGRDVDHFRRLVLCLDRQPDCLGAAARRGSSVLKGATDADLALMDCVDELEASSGNVTDFEEVVLAECGVESPL